MNPLPDKQVPFYYPDKIKLPVRIAVRNSKMLLSKKPSKASEQSEKWGLFEEFISLPAPPSCVLQTKKELDKEINAHITTLNKKSNKARHLRKLQSEINKIHRAHSLRVTKSHAVAQVGLETDCHDLLRIAKQAASTITSDLHNSVVGRLDGDDDPKLLTPFKKQIDNYKEAIRQHLPVVSYSQATPNL